MHCGLASAVEDARSGLFVEPWKWKAVIGKMHPCLKRPKWKAPAVTSIESCKFAGGPGVKISGWRVKSWFGSAERQSLELEWKPQLRPG